MARRPPVVLQAETSECGLACLCMVLGYQGHGIALTELRQRHPSGAALSFQDLLSMAEGFGLSGRALRVEPTDLAHVTLPAILHMDFDHYVVLEAVRKNNYAVIDPARGRMTLASKVFGRRFTGVLLELQPGVEFRRRSLPTRTLLSVPAPTLQLGRIMPSLAGLFALSLCIQAFALISPFFLQLVVDEVLIAMNVELSLLLVLAFAAVHGVSALTQWFRGLLTIHLGNHLSYLLAADLMRHLLNLQPVFFQRRSVGDIVSRFGSLRPVQEFISEQAIGLLLDLLMMLGTLVMLAAYLPMAAGYTLIVLATFLLIQYLLAQPLRRFNQEYLVVDAEAQSHFVESIQSMESIRRYERQSRRCHDWLNLTTEALNARMHAGRIQLMAETARYLMGGATTLGIIYLAIDHVLSASISIGMLYAMMTYANHFTGAALSFTRGWQALLMLSLHSQRLGDITESPGDKRVPLERTAGTAMAEIQQVVLRNVSFSFEACAYPLLDRLSFTIEENASIAITGPSGCGKTTLLSLLLGDRQPTEGEILVNQRPLAAGLTAISVTSTLMPQDGLLQANVIDNITCLDEAPDQERMIRAAHLACIHEDILKLPLAYREMLSESHCLLSAGQRQRLLIARALYRNRGLLLLDEATSHLDIGLELKVMSNILAQPGICIFITHRDSVAALADRVIELGNGSESDREPAALSR
jgi:ATP-binding cassette subfamily B protein RaxB